MYVYISRLSSFLGNRYVDERKRETLTTLKISSGHSKIPNKFTQIRTTTSKVTFAERTN